ncbi:hypothetical protein AC239_29580 [Bacteroides fragilis]|nr:hypothetical protein AC239_29580 [Bacteroides fragilis]
MGISCSYSPSPDAHEADSRHRQSSRHARQNLLFFLLYS